MQSIVNQIAIINTRRSMLILGERLEFVIDFDEKTSQRQDDRVSLNRFLFVLLMTFQLRKLHPGTAHKTKLNSKASN
jgi:hypothetical protein